MTSIRLFETIGYPGDCSKVQNEFLEMVEINESFYEFAKAIKKEHKLALITDDVSEWSQYLRKKYGLNEYFDVITVSGDVKIRKPDLRIFQLTLDRLGYSPEECVYIDDRRHYLAGAEEVGIHTVLFNTRKVPYQGHTVNSFEELLVLITTIEEEERKFIWKSL